MVGRTRRQASRRRRVAHAFAPGHLTGIFVPATQARDPRARGSLGAGIVLELGAWANATYDVSDGPSVSVVSDRPGPLPISTDVARRLAEGRPGRLRIELRHELPIGQGFGMSAAGAFATGLAAARVLGVERARAREVAHLADLFGGGGLGGVSAILEGGWEHRVTAGLPPAGRIVHRPFRRRLWLAVVGGPLPSPRLLGSAGFLAKVGAAGRPGLRELARRPSVPTLLAESERFTDRLGLGSAAMRAALRRLRAAGAWAGQSMFGRSLWAVPRSPADRSAVVQELDRLRLPAVELAASDRGAWAADGPMPREQAF